ncbi:unnamed protein product [Cylicostephanus goldi]|uniref:Uncharacterized protein n=1 Tax=Cylicostephanus goldi TaxID=71465 RepID=A0A3P7MJV2_CYLGO|nr:unnamed protein product [Cylicostephanus goldi]
MAARRLKSVAEEKMPRHMLTRVYGEEEGKVVKKRSVVQQHLPRPRPMASNQEYDDSTDLSDVEVKEKAPIVADGLNQSRLFSTSGPITLNMAQVSCAPMRYAEAFARMMSMNPAFAIRSRIDVPVWLNREAIGVERRRCAPVHFDEPDETERGQSQRRRVRRLMGVESDSDSDTSIDSYFKVKMEMPKYSDIEVPRWRKLSPEELVDITRHEDDSCDRCSSTRLETLVARKHLRLAKEERLYFEVRFLGGL